MPDGDESGRTVLSRALAILAAFTVDRPELTLAQLCRITDLRHSTAHRQVAELLEWGAVERLPNGAYVIGLRLWELGTLNPRALPLRAHALPIMEDLHSATRQHVQLAVLEGMEAVVVERISGQTVVSVASPVGGRLPLHATAAGRVLLAYGGEDLFRYVTGSTLARFTVSTITEAEPLRRVTAQCRHDGFAVVREELTTGTYSVAAPILDSRGQVEAALSVVSSNSKVRAMAPAVVLAARGVSRNRGLRGRSV
ncbi:IclR family transcriptional regulator (plasmid) [Rhodococcus erythropolis R138]|nr:IclR family transcriptional regulator [Rhodococcus erythropolis R138]